MTDGQAPATLWAMGSEPAQIFSSLLNKKIILKKKIKKKRGKKKEKGSQIPTQLSVSCNKGEVSYLQRQYLSVLH